MKKLASLLLALSLTLALAIPAFAADGENVITPNKGESTKDVEATYAAPEDTSAGNVYYFEVRWTPDTAKTLSYTGAKTTYTWNGETMKYTGKVTNESEAGWKGSAAYKVEVINQSNAAVTATTKADTKFGLKATAVVDEGGSETQTLDSAAKKITSITDTETAGEATKLTVTYTIDNSEDSGTAPTGVDAGDTKVTVATISVTVTHD